MRFMLPSKKSVDEAEILKNEFDTLLQDQLTELRPLRRRSEKAHRAKTGLSVERDATASGLGTVVKIGG